MSSKTKLETLVKSLIQFIGDSIGPTDSLSPAAAVESDTEIVKAVDQEERRALFVVLAPEVVDEHGDIYSAVEVEKACKDFNLNCMKANLFHRVETEHAHIEQSFITLSSFQTDAGQKIEKGTWLQWWHFPETEVGELIWKSVKSGEINGVSIGCTAKTEVIE